MKQAASLVLALIVVGFMTGCASAHTEFSSTAASYTASAPAEEGAYGVYDQAVPEHSEAGNLVPVSAELPGESGMTQADSTQRKVILDVTLDLQTKEYDAGIEAIRACTQDVGGAVFTAQVEGQNLYHDAYGTRSATFVLQIPAENLEQFVLAISQSFTVTNTIEEQRDVTAQYFDLQTRLESLRTQHARLLELMENAGDLTDLVALEAQMAQVSYEIDRYTSSLQQLQGKITYSTVTIHLYEVVEYSQLPHVPATFRQRASDTFSRSWQDFGQGIQSLLVGFIYFLPVLLVLLAMGGVAVLIILTVRKKRRKFNEKQLEPATPKQHPEDNDKTS